MKIKHAMRRSLVKDTLVECIVCGKEVRRSKRAKCCCKACERKRVKQAANEMREKKGKLYLKWKRNLAKSI